MQHDKKQITPVKTYSNTWGQLTQYEVAYGKEKVIREVYDSRGDGAACLLYNSDRDAVILVRQWRITAQLQGIDHGYILEAPAGLLDDQDSKAAMIRELEEETGYRSLEITPIYNVFSSPGAHLEQIYLFYGTVTDAMQVSDGGGVASEHEEIEVVHIPRSEIALLLQEGTICDAKTVILLQDFLINQASRLAAAD